MEILNMLFEGLIIVKEGKSFANSVYMSWGEGTYEKEKSVLIKTNTETGFVGSW